MIKPSELDLAGVKRSIKQHTAVLTNNLMRLYNLKSRQAEVAEVCLRIMKCPNGERIKIEPGRLSTYENNEIKNYFGECMAPIWLMRGLVSGIKPHDDCFFETNNEFWDLKVYRGKEPLLISSKTMGPRTNVMKPDAVMREINGNGDLYYKWNNEIPYQVLKTLDDYKTFNGPITAVMRHYASAVKVSQNDLQNVIRQLTKANAILDDVPESIMNLISNDDLARRQYEDTEEVNAMMINFIFEKILIQQTNKNPKFNDLFIDANKRNVHILKFDFDLSGKVSYSLQSPKNITGAALRSKNGIGRLADKVGFAIP